MPVKIILTIHTFNNSCVQDIDTDLEMNECVENTTCMTDAI